MQPEINILRANARELHEALKACHHELSHWQSWAITTRKGYVESSGFELTRDAIRKGSYTLERIGKAQSKLESPGHQSVIALV